MLLVRICWGPARGRFAGSGGFGFRILDFEFVWDFDIGISDFPFWLRPRAALGGCGQFPWPPPSVKCRFQTETSDRFRDPHLVGDLRADHRLPVVRHAP